MAFTTKGHQHNQRVFNTIYWKTADMCYVSQDIN